MLQTSLSAAILKSLVKMLKNNRALNFASTSQRLDEVVTLNGM